MAGAVLRARCGGHERLGTLDHPWRPLGASDVGAMIPHTQRRFLTRLLGALCVLLTAFHLFRQLPAAARVGGMDRDLAVYYAAAREARARRSPYTSPGAWTLSQ